MRFRLEKGRDFHCAAFCAMEPGCALPEQECEQDGEREKQKQKKNKIKRTQVGPWDI